jgi:hypothetical protein
MLISIWAQCWMTQHYSVTNATEVHQPQWEMLESSFCGNFSGWRSSTFDSPLSPSALPRPDGKSDWMVSFEWQPSWEHLNRMKVDCQLTILLFAMQSWPWWTPVLRHRSVRCLVPPFWYVLCASIFSCVLSCVRHVLTRRVAHFAMPNLTKPSLFYKSLTHFISPMTTLATWKFVPLKIQDNTVEPTCFE